MTPKAFMDAVLVAEIQSEVAKSGIVMPDGVHSIPNRGVVESVGHLIDHLEPGQIVYYCEHDHPRIGNSTVVPGTCIMAYEE